MTVTEAFKNGLREVWGSPRQVAQKGFSELFNHEEELGLLDYDDQINYALDIGVLAGEMKDKTPEEFIESFEKLFE